MIGTFGGCTPVHPSLVRFPYVNAANAPTDEKEDDLYRLWRFMSVFDREMSLRAYIRTYMN